MLREMVSIVILSRIKIRAYYIQQSMKINMSNNVIAPKLQNMFAHFALRHVNNTNGKYVLYKRKSSRYIFTKLFQFETLRYKSVIFYNLIIYPVH